MTEDQRQSRGVPEGGAPGLASVHDLFSGRGRPGTGGPRRGRKSDPGDESGAVVSLDGTRLNQHDLRDMIAQKEAEWRSETARSAETTEATEPGPSGDGEPAQPSWSTPGWADGESSTRSRGGRSRGLRRIGPGPDDSEGSGAGGFADGEFGSGRTGFGDGRGRGRGDESGGRGSGDPAERGGRSGRGGASGRRSGFGDRAGRAGRRARDLDVEPDGEDGESPEESGFSRSGTGRSRDGARRSGLNRKPREDRKRPAEESRPPDDPEEAAREILLKQLSAGDRTRSQLAKVLAQKEIPDDVAAAVLDRFEAVSLVDDAAFSRQYVENRHSGRGLAKRALAYELRQKGVADETVREAVDSLSSDDELAAARQLVRKKAGSMTKDDPERRLRRLAGMLARKGYSSGIAYQAIREELADLDAEGYGNPDFD